MRDFQMSSFPSIAELVPFEAENNYEQNKQLVCIRSES